MLDDELLIAVVSKALAKRCPRSRSGRPATPAESVLRLRILKHARNWSYLSWSGKYVPIWYIANSPKIVRRDKFCQQFITVPSVCPIVTITCKTAVDDPYRIKRSRGRTTIRSNP